MKDMMKEKHSVKRKKKLNFYENKEKGVIVTKET